MAVWLAERVGPAGHVVAADIDTRYPERLDLPNLQMIKHDILEDPLDVLGPGSFDLVPSGANPGGTPFPLPAVRGGSITLSTSRKRRSHSLCDESPQPRARWTGMRDLRDVRGRGSTLRERV